LSGIDIPIITPGDSIDGIALGVNEYEKAALGFLALKELMGDDPFKQALHEFMARWNGKRPTPWDMFNTFNDVSDQELNWFFERWFFEPNYIDLAVSDVQKTDGGYLLQVENRGGKPIPFDVAVTYADGTQASFRQNPALWQNSPDSATIALGTDQDITKLVLDGGIFLDITDPDNTWEPAQ
jgi:aminopeptidase N